jgi:hypothetical protein
MKAVDMCRGSAVERLHSPNLTRDANKEKLIFSAIRVSLRVKEARDKKWVASWRPEADLNHRPVP